MWTVIANYWPFAVLGPVLVAAAVADLRSGRIHNAITYPAIALGLVGHALAGGLGGGNGQLGLAGSAAGLAVGFLPMLAFWLVGGIGGGDAKLMAAVGALTGWRFALSAMFYGFAVAAILAVIVMLRRKLLRRTLARVGRFLILAVVPGKKVDPASADSPKVAFGLALCIGSAVAMIEALWRNPQALKLLGL